MSEHDIATAFSWINNGPILFMQATAGTSVLTVECIYSSRKLLLLLIPTLPTPLSNRGAVKNPNCPMAAEGVGGPTELTIKSTHTCTRVATDMKMHVASAGVWAFLPSLVRQAAPYQVLVVSGLPLLSSAS